MGLGGRDDKTEKPTGKRLREAREKGQVFQSKDISTVIVLYGVFRMMKYMVSFLHVTIRQYMLWLFGGIGGEMGQFLSARFFFVTLEAILKCALPPLLTASVLGILSHGIQTRFNISAEVIKPKFGKLNPVTGMKNLFSFKKLVETIKDLIKIAVLLAVLYSIIMEDLAAASRMIDMNLFNSASYMLSMIDELVKKVCLAFTVIAGADFMFQRWQYQKDLMMTKQEVKDEFKQQEGNPQIKGRIRSMQRQMAMSRMMQMVGQADVIVKNPTHFAVALKYDPGKNSAPIVLAKGQDELALRIIRTGEEHGVLITEHIPLARALYAAAELNREIPAEFYGAVAEILVYIYKAGGRDEMFE